MDAFSLFLPSQTLFGRGTLESALPHIAQFGKRCLIVHGKRSEPARALAQKLEEHGVRWSYISCPKEPDISVLSSALNVARNSQIDCVIGLGGGAALDLAKAIAGLARCNGDLYDYLEVVGKGLPLDGEPLPFIAIPTTSGTGSEATRNAVITAQNEQRKVSIRDPRMIAKLVVLDPSLTDHCPKAVTMASGLDAITQLIEPYICSRANAFTDALVLQALPPALNAIVKLSRQEDPAARDALSWAAYCSGLALANAGLGAVHGLAGVVGGLCGAPHGEVCATLLAPSLRVNRTAMEKQKCSLNRINWVEDQLAKAFADFDGDGGVEMLDHFVAAQGIRSLEEMGLDAGLFDEVARQSAASSSMKANPVPLTAAQLIEIMDGSKRPY